MNELEGVIKFGLDFEPAPAPERSEIKELNWWRQKLYRLQLIGQDPERYGGYGFGNVSCVPTAPVRPGIRRATDQIGLRSFLITGTQTGHIPELGPEHYVWVTNCDPQRNWLSARGPIRPSSESLTHGAIYACLPSCNAVIHVHSPLLWHCARELNIPVTDERVLYGTPGMAREISEQLSKTNSNRTMILAMGGHLDGVIVHGTSLSEAGDSLLSMLTVAKRASVR